jgi:drug/metabolite transporter (DMT)-like permease
MKTITSKQPLLLIIVAFAAIYIVWGSTYFFIQIAVHDFPPMLMGALRFLIAGALLMAWCYIKGDKIWVTKNVTSSAISGLLMLFVSMGVVISVEKFLPSSIVAIMTSANPIWFVVLDKGNWKTNFSNKFTISGIILGFAGVLLLFGEAIGKSVNGSMSATELTGLILMIFAPAAWCAGGLYSKIKGGNAPARLNTAWQMLIAGLVFIPASFIHGEYATFHIGQVSAQAWMALCYLILFGSIGAFSAYVWLLSVRPATEVSTHSYINPVVAVLLGVLFAGEHVSLLQLSGLVVILFSVLLVNFTKYSLNLPKFLKRENTKTGEHAANPGEIEDAYEICINK